MSDIQPKKKERSQPEQFFFQKITDAKELAGIFTSLGSEKIETIIKTSKGYLSSRLLFVSPPRSFATEKAPEFQIFTPLNATVFFEIRGQKYLCGATVQNSHGMTQVEMQELFFVQRRNSFRVRLPKGSPISFIITKCNGSPKMTSCSILDISSKGIRIQSNQDFTAGNQIQGELRQSTGASIELKAIVRHSAFAPKETNRYNIGLELTELSSETENFLFLLTLDLYRKIYGRKDI